MEQLQQEVKEAEAVVAENTAAVHQQQSTVNAAVQAAQQATAQVRKNIEVMIVAIALVELFIRYCFSNTTIVKIAHKFRQNYNRCPCVLKSMIKLTYINNK